MSTDIKQIYASLVGRGVDVSDKVIYPTDMLEYFDSNREQNEQKGIEVIIDKEAILVKVSVDRVQDSYNPSFEPNMAVLEVFNGEDCEKQTGDVILNLDERSFDLESVSPENLKKVVETMEEVGYSKPEYLKK
jgi:hypothetical protein